MKNSRAIYIGCGLDVRPLHPMFNYIKHFYYIDIYPQKIEKIGNISSALSPITYMKKISNLDNILLFSGFRLKYCSHYIRKYKQKNNLGKMKNNKNFKYSFLQKKRYLTYFTNIKYPNDFLKIKSYIPFFNIIFCGKYKPNICFLTQIYLNNLINILEKTKWNKITLVTFENDNYLIDENDKNSIIYYLYNNKGIQNQFLNFKQIVYKRNNPILKTFSSWKEFIDFQLSKCNFNTNYLLDKIALSKNEDDNGSNTIKIEQSYDSVSERSGSTIKL